MKLFFKIFIVIFVALLVIGSVFLYQGYNMYKEAISETSINDKITDIKSDENYITLSEVPDIFPKAIIAVEDHRFKEHGAIDIIAICRAIVSNIKAMELVEGGSTITQQVAKNLYFIEYNDSPAIRKIAEIFLANDLENLYSKDDILELYMNTIYYGDGYYGIKEACKGYLNKEPKDMDINESTMMAGIPNAPSVYAPTINPDLTKKRQEKVIYSLVKYGYITQEEADSIPDSLPQIVEK